jgi:hypothetical protein
MKTKQIFLIKNIQFLRPKNNALPFHEVGLNFIYLINLLRFRLAHWVPCLVKTLANGKNIYACNFKHVKCKISCF